MSSAKICHHLIIIHFNWSMDFTTNISRYVCPYYICQILYKVSSWNKDICQYLLNHKVSMKAKPDSSCWRLIRSSRIYRPCCVLGLTCCESINADFMPAVISVDRTIRWPTSCFFTCSVSFICEKSFSRWFYYFMLHIFVLHRGFMYLNININIHIHLYI